jgi:uncharacterized repeat protein (TIGR04138 family)
MKQLTEVWHIIEEITRKDIRYKANVYSFVMAALEQTINSIGERRHITATELLEGIREAGLEQFGPMAKEVFNFWGVYKTEDFGNVVFNLIEAGLAGKTEEDSIEDFSDGYDFKKVFEDDYFNC